jgi:hypothetical protein
MQKKSKKKIKNKERWKDKEYLRIWRKNKVKYR